MQVAIRTRSALRIALVLGLFLVASLAHDAAGQDAKTELLKNRSLKVKFIPGKSYPDVVLVQLYQDGKLLREREASYSNASPLPQTIEWLKLAPGRYEVHFEGKGYARAVKKVFISSDDVEETMIVIEMDSKKSLESGGDGPTLHGLTEEIKQLKEEIKQLKEEVKRLKGAPTPMFK